jgi:uncharacterized membrane protein (DUF373 family)
MTNRVFDRVTRSVTIVLLVLMTLVVVLSTLDLGREIFLAVSKPPYIFIAVEGLLEIFGMFLLVLIGIELLDTLHAYLTENVVHEEVILAAALIAVARKVIVLDIKELDALKLIGIGVIIMAVAGAYWIVKQSHVKICSHSKPPPVAKSTTPPAEG